MGGANLYEKEITKIIQDLSMHECSNEIKRKTGESQNLIGFILDWLEVNYKKLKRKRTLFAQKKKFNDN